jgi:anti-sigma factor RsiW
MTPCTEIQNTIAHGLALTAEQSQHMATCSGCAAVAEHWSRLDMMLTSAQVEVADGFADRVMARLDEPTAVPDLLERRWVQITLANLGALVTMANLIRFVMRLLIPSTSLGALP